VIKLITVPYARFKDDFYKYSGKITSQTSNRKIKVYFTSPDARKEAHRQDEKGRTQKAKKARRTAKEFLRWKKRLR
jgi:hypothetical protein